MTDTVWIDEFAEFTDADYAAVMQRVREPQWTGVVVSGTGFSAPHHEPTELAQQRAAKLARGPVLVVGMRHWYQTCNEVEVGPECAQESAARVYLMRYTKANDELYAASAVKVQGHAGGTGLWDELFGGPETSNLEAYYDRALKRLLLANGSWDLHRLCERIVEAGRTEGWEEPQVRALLALANRARQIAIRCGAQIPEPQLDIPGAELAWIDLNRRRTLTLWWDSETAHTTLSWNDRNKAGDIVRPNDQVIAERMLWIQLP